MSLRSATFPAVTARVRHAEPVMGTVVSFDVPVQARADGSLDAAIRWLHWVDRVFSPYRPDSDVSLLAGGRDHRRGLRGRGRRGDHGVRGAAGLSGGYFSAAAGGRFDPSGYVKGWAVERCAEILSRGRVGQPPGQRRRRRPVRRRPAARLGLSPWRVGIADPVRRGRLALVVEAADSAVATSGTAERGAHIVDPHAGRAGRGPGQRHRRRPVAGPGRRVRHRRLRHGPAARP